MKLYCPYSGIVTEYLPEVDMSISSPNPFFELSLDKYRTLTKYGLSNISNPLVKRLAFLYPMVKTPSHFIFRNAVTEFDPMLYLTSFKDLQLAIYTIKNNLNDSPSYSISTSSNSTDLSSLPDFLVNILETRELKKARNLELVAQRITERMDLDAKRRLALGQSPITKTNFNFICDICHIKDPETKELYYNLITLPLTKASFIHNASIELYDFITTLEDTYSSSLIKLFTLRLAHARQKDFYEVGLKVPDAVLGLSNEDLSMEELAIKQKATFQFAPAKPNRADYPTTIEYAKALANYFKKSN